MSGCKHINREFRPHGDGAFIPAEMRDKLQDNGMYCCDCPTFIPLRDNVEWLHNHIAQLNAEKARLEHEHRMCHTIAGCTKNNCKANGYQCPMGEAQQEGEEEDCGEWLKEIAADCTEAERQQLERAMDKTQVQRTRKLRQSHNDKGLIQVTVWVPSARRDELKKTAATWRKEAEIPVS